MMYLKQSTSVTAKIGPFVDESDGYTAEGSLTIAQADIRLSKNGGNFAQSNDAGGATHDENGYYDITLDATDTNTLGRLQVAVNESGALPVWHEFMVLPSNVYDSLVSGSDNLEVDTALIEGVDATDQINAEVDTALADYDAPTKAELDSGLAAFNDPTAADIADAVWDEATVGHVSAGSFGEEMQAHALSVEISALNDLSAAQVNAEVDTALTDYDAPTKAELDSGLAALNDPTAADIADAVWDEVITGAEHNVNNSSARFLRESAEASAGVTGTAQAGGAASITLEAGADSNDDIYNNERISILEGTGAGQARLISDYDGTTKVATVNNNWVVQPDSTSIYSIAGADVEVDAIETSALAGIADAVLDEPITELAGIWSFPSSLREIVGWLGAVYKNKRITNSNDNTDTVRNQDDDADIASASISDVSNVFTRGEYS